MWIVEVKDILSSTGGNIVLKLEIICGWILWFERLSTGVMWKSKISQPVSNLWKWVVPVSVQCSKSLWLKICNAWEEKENNKAKPKKMAVSLEDIFISFFNAKFGFI